MTNLNVRPKFQDFLLSEFESRKTGNPRYSLRAYARDLGLAAPKLSEILREKCGLSEVAAHRLVPKLGLNSGEAMQFTNLVASKHARSPAQRKKALENLHEAKLGSEIKEIQLGTFDLISEWHYNAILELTETVGFNSEIKWIAKRLNLSEESVARSIQQLLDLNLLARDQSGELYQTEKDLATPSNIPSLKIRMHHRQILSKAAEAINNVPINERDFSSVTFAVSEKTLNEAKVLIKEFRRKLVAKLSTTKPKERVYCLSIQLFPLERKL